MLFDKVGFNNVWENQNSFGRNRLTYAMYKQLRNYFIKFWEESILKKYHWKKRKQIKNLQGFEEEIWDGKPFEIRYWQIWYFKFVRLRIRNIILMIEKGSHRKIDLENSLCSLCKFEVEEELQFTIKCTILHELRNTC